MEEFWQLSPCQVQMVFLAQQPRRKRGSVSDLLGMFRTQGIPVEVVPADEA